MVSRMDMSPRLVAMLEENFPFVFEPEYMEDSSEHRWLDALETYSGAGNLSKAMERVSHLN